MAEVAGIVLAAGTSSRMGRNKLLLEVDTPPYGFEPLVRRAVRTALAAGLQPVIVVLGHEADRVAAALGGLPCRPVVNARFAEGQSTSLQAGIGEAAALKAPAAVVLLADMPLVTAAMVEGVCERQRETGAPLVVSRYGDVDAPPTLYTAGLYPEVLALTGARCGKQVVRRHRDEAAWVPWPEEALRDVDVAEDYQQVRARLARQGPP
jgi:molybdenum cofactor cytidylyltransferase